MDRIFPISYFGSISYYKEIVNSEFIQVEGWEHYPKQTLRNRCTILTANGLLNLSIPIIKENGAKTYTKDITISNTEKWRMEHWRAIQNAYKAAPYFEYYGNEVKELIFSNFHNLIDYDMNISNRILSWLDVNVQVKVSTDYVPNYDFDFRSSFTKKSFDEYNDECPYKQVFPTINSYDESISILDLIFCHGPLAHNLILSKND